MKFIADLHVHSKFSRATAKNLDFENLYVAAQLKGISVVGTGDFTHPGWFAEIGEKLEPAEPGFFKLKSEVAEICDRQVPASCRNPVRFLLSAEISNIYKKDGKTRKNHNLVLMPDLETAAKFNAKLDNIGNIKSDGRPILGLDVRNLLEILLETTDQGFLIPAHIWTPWFSILGSKSGFDSIEACFEDLTSHIFAVETGLSSDPPMNWRVSGLDGLTLVSNSDAHSPLNLGREANLFDAPLSFDGIKSALKHSDTGAFLGTFEFYPQEGKYHLDGHRNCKITLRPAESKYHDSKCPVCGKALTLGVLNRVEELADREEGSDRPGRLPFYSIIPLPEIIADILQVGVKSKKVMTNYHKALMHLGNEFDILHRIGTDTIDGVGVPLLGEAIRRVRQKKVAITPGYDGEYGCIQIFKAYERDRLLGQKTLFSMPSPDPGPQKVSKSMTFRPKGGMTDSSASVKSTRSRSTAYEPQSPQVFNRLNAEQRRAVEYPDGPLLIVAGPGTGKTRTLTHRIAYLILKRKVIAGHVLAVTFTNKAAVEMRDRLKKLLGEHRRLPIVGTFHSFCYHILNEQNQEAGQTPKGIIDDDQRQALITAALSYVREQGCKVSLNPKLIASRIASAKQQILDPEEFVPANAEDDDTRMLADIYRTYQNMLSIQNFYDYEDLIFQVVRRLEADAEIRKKYRNQFQHIFVDEYQDLNQAQYRILKALASGINGVRNLCVIGDPDQSIYGFRGSDVTYFSRFIEDYPDAAVIELNRNYRSTTTILNASFQVIQNHRHRTSDNRIYSDIDGVKTIGIIETASAKSEAQTVAGIIEQQLGGTGFHSVDTGRVIDANITPSWGYSDFAVLYRTNDQQKVFEAVFEQTGIPYQVASRESALNRKGLPEIMSLLKVIEGQGGFLDYENISGLMMSGIGRKSLNLFKDWCYQHRFTLQAGFVQAARFPIPGLKTSSQLVLNELNERLENIKIELSGLPVSEKLRYLESNTALYRVLDTDEKTREAFARLVETATLSGGDVTDFFCRIALHTDTDAYVQQAEKVSLMTMHAAKGLEFAVVFIAGCEEGLIPFTQTHPRQADIAEERRLFYVAMTRAMERLYFTRAKKRLIYGKQEDRKLSRFVADIENRLKTNDTPPNKKKKSGSGQIQLKLF